MYQDGGLKELHKPDRDPEGGSHPGLLVGGIPAESHLAPANQTTTYLLLLHLPQLQHPGQLLDLSHLGAVDGGGALAEEVEEAVHGQDGEVGHDDVGEAQRIQRRAGGATGRHNPVKESATLRGGE